MSDADAARSALRTIGAKWDAIGKVPRERAPELERRMRAVEKKVRDAATTAEQRPGGRRPGPSSSGSVPSSSSQQAAKAEAAGRTKDAEQARASAAQWREWAEAAVQALGKKR